MNHMIDGDSGKHPFSPKYNREHETKTCPVCDGVPTESDEQPCDECKGAGEVLLTAEEMDELEADREANAAEAAWEAANVQLCKLKINNNYDNMNQEKVAIVEQHRDNMIEYLSTQKMKQEHSEKFIQEITKCSKWLIDFK